MITKKAFTPKNITITIMWVVVLPFMLALTLQAITEVTGWKEMMGRVENRWLTTNEN